MAPRKYPYEMKGVSPDEEKVITRCLYGYIRCGGFTRCGPAGYIMPAKFKRCSEQIYNMKVRHDDIWVITFPRSGTTWTQEMVWLLENDLDFGAATNRPLYERFPMLEMTSHVPDIAMLLIKANFMNLGNFQGLDSAVRTPSWELIENAPSPRFIKTHLPLSMLPPTLLSTAKVIYVARDPRDVAVSYYYLHKMVGKGLVRATFKEFWEAFRRDLIPYTPVINHAEEAWQQRHQPNLHFLHFEDLKKNLPLEIRKMCKFLGREYSDTQLEQLARHLSFENLKKNKHVNNNIDPDNKVQFIRKGETGAWVKYFDEKMLVQIDDYFNTRMRSVDIRYPSVSIDIRNRRPEVTHL